MLGGRGCKVNVHFFQNLKMTISFQQNHIHFIGFLQYLYAFGGEGRGLQKVYVLYTHENDEKDGQPLNIIS